MSSNFKKAIDSVRKACEDKPVNLSGDFAAWPALSTGSIVLDKVIGIGGVPRGKIIEIFGDESAGKTTLGISLCIQAQKSVGQKEIYPIMDDKGKKIALDSVGTALYIDFEHAFHPGYARAIGLDTSPERFLLYQPDYFEKGAAIVKHFLAESKSQHRRLVDVIVLDSVSAMIPKSEFEGELDDSKRVGWQAALMSQFLSATVRKLTKLGITFVCINQLRPAVILDKYAPKDTDAKRGYRTSGGRALKFYSMVRIKLQATKKEKGFVLNPLTGKQDQVPISTMVKAETVKNKVWFPFRTGEFVIRYGEGIDNVRSVIDVAVASDIIEKGGSWFSYESTVKEHCFTVQGSEKLRKEVLAHKDLIFEIQEKLIAKSSEITKASDLPLDDAKIVVENLEVDEFEETDD
jgi:recombination protein RecA